MNNPTPLKIIFMGTPDFAVPALNALNESPHLIQAVVTVPDKQQGRGRRERPSAVKSAALECNLPILQPEKLTDPDFIDRLRAYAPDVIVVVAFRILPEAVFTLPKYGSFNLHASLLPKYRGAAPIHWALLNGDSETGLTTFFLKRRVDTGNIIKQAKTPILPEDNLHTLYAKLCNMGAGLVLETTNLIAGGTAVAGEQDNSLASPAPKVTSETRLIHFDESAEQCHNRVRAFAPKPGAYTYRDGGLLKILSTRKVKGQGTPGTIIQIAEDSFTVACHEDALEIISIQPESKKVMDVASYLRGYPIETGETLG
ncbi:MAG: methionyl-tRNA formyltransferase [Candidatus Marinimicrobia bacterium]|jgi:methionyl-tRNA formyltransferase|nr:methionyl-tRNA formyltransferase [Candidatus Neomarinimicrobiota bacterium]MBT4716037.1 methionyl-tRNA formyltransferase [Candidatus Neomarinimicrobiota bacterium]MBT4947461.1 methionyl-tRNA formyltransferase [Candidatus Neomarinimicrobiota bacterium]MBT5270558.1 methionyl-tRNA formyltransferase [Candidatus Neomarinimicrobiota bacterium]MBT6011104.1 methionyl-tRNA formyltransferase [Candidatus Neomarinimicrobiota bacterium]